MRKSGRSLRKLVSLSLLLFFSCSACFSEAEYMIRESELDRILAETEELTRIVSEQSSQLSQLRILSEELRSEAESERRRAQIYKGVAVGACVSAALLGGALYLMSRN